MKDYSAPYAVAEEIANGITHGLGVIASIVGLAVLVAHAAMHGGVIDVTAVSIYGSSLILLYTASTLYHSIPIAAAKRILKIIDHSAIYILIAGTYTPFALIPLRDTVGWTLFTIIWSMAAAGIVFKLFFTGRMEKLSVAVYLAMGWLIVWFADPVMATVPVPGLWLMLAGGLAYTFGVVFYVWHTLVFNHAIWHLFVIAGSVTQYLAVLWYVVPSAPAHG